MRVAQMFGRRGARNRAAAFGVAVSALSISTAAAQSQQAVTATASSERTFSIPAGPLSAALVAFGRQAGVQISYVPSIASGVTTAGASGSFAPGAALAKILAGSGLSYHFAGAHTVLIEKPAAASAAGAPAGGIALDTINVQCVQESGWGPVDGYVARQTVSATKTDTPIIEIPQSISVIPREQLKAQAVQTVGEALRYTPGVVAEEYGGTDLRIDQYMVRGFPSSNPYIDGLSTGGIYTLLAPNVDPYALERVEVLRGPSSVLYGQNVPGGLISLITKRPTAAPLHEVELQPGGPLGIQGAFDLSGPVTDDGTLLYRLTGLARDSRTQVDQVNTRHYFLAPSITYSPSADTTFTLLTNFQRSADGVLVQNLPATGTLYPAPFGKIPTNLFIGEPGFNKIDRSSYSIGYSFEHRLNDEWTIRQNLRYSYTSTTVNQIGTGGLEPGTALLDRSANASNAHVASFGVDTQAEAKFDTFGVQHTALFGIDFYWSHDRWVEQDGVAAPLNLLNPIYGQPFTLPPPDFATDDQLAQVGLYAQDQIKWDHWVVTAGLRHDWAQTSTTDLLAGSTIPQNDQAFSGRAGLVYLFDNGLAPYASYSTSFQPTVGATFENVPFKPTAGKQYEVGVKYQPTGFRSFIMLSAYNIDQTNVLTADPAPDHPFAQVQTGAIRVRGLEASGVIDLDDGLKAVAAYSYTDGRITADNSGDVGNVPADIPRHMASLWMDKTLQSGPLQGFGVGGGVRYVGGHFGDNANTLPIPGNVLFDASIHYDYKNWRLAVNAKNLFDRTYVATCGSAEFCYYGLRRTILGTIAYRW